MPFLAPLRNESPRVPKWLFFNDHIRMYDHGMSPLEIFVTAVGLMMSFSYYPQAWRMYRMKSAEEISLVSFGVLALGNTVWTLYGFYLRSWVIIASFFFGAIGAYLVLLFKWKYRRSHE